MNLIIAAILLIITLYTFGLAIALWKERQRFGALATFFLCLLIIGLPFFSIFK